MKDEIFAMSISLVLGVLLGAALMSQTSDEELITVPREEVINISATPAGYDTPDVVMSATTAEAQDAAPSAVSFVTEPRQLPITTEPVIAGVTRRDAWDTSAVAQEGTAKQPPNYIVTDGPTPLTEEQFADLQRWLKSGGSLQEWADKHPDPALTVSCPTCKGAGIFHDALCPTCDGAAAATLTKDGVTFSEQGFKPQQAAPAGRWLTVPAYGPLGRQRGYQRVWQSYGTQQYYAPGCAGGRCR